MEWEYCPKPSLSCLSLGNTYSFIASLLHSNTTVDLTAVNSCCQIPKSHSVIHEPYRSNCSSVELSPALSCKPLAAGRIRHFDWSLGSPLAILETSSCISMIGNQAGVGNMSCELCSRHLENSCLQLVGLKGSRIPPFDQSLTPQLKSAFSLGPVHL